MTHLHPLLNVTFLLILIHLKNQSGLVVAVEVDHEPKPLIHLPCLEIPMSNPPVLDEDTIGQIDLDAPLFVDAVHCGDPEAIERIVAGLDRTALIGLAISIASLAESTEPTQPVLSLVDPSEGWSKPELRAAHAAYERGLRDYRTRLGERIYQRLKARASRARAKGEAV
nr:hypothetical protein [Rhodococcus sp. 06-621-2]